MSTARLQVTHFSDPGCPWAYSASPAFAVLRWRYGGQLEWRHVLIGLTEDAEQYVRRGYTPVRSAVGYQRFRRFRMPFALHPAVAPPRRPPGLPPLGPPCPPPPPARPRANERRLPRGRRHPPQRPGPRA